MRRLGLRKLTSHFDAEFLEQYSELSGSNISEKKVAQLLFNAKGYSLLKNREFRNDIISLLDDTNKATLGDFVNITWSKNSAKAQALLEILKIPIEDCFDIRETEDEDLNYKFSGEYSLFPHQLTVKHQLIEAFEKRKNRMLIHLPTGAGKTRTTVDSIFEIYRYKFQHKGLIVWLAHTQELCEQAYETAVSAWKKKGDTDLNVYRLWGRYSLNENELKNGFVVGSLQKMYSMLNSKKDEDFATVNQISRNSCLLIVDEAHKANAPTYSKIIEWIASDDRCPLIGLTATPGRSWEGEENRQLANFFYGNKYTILDDSGNELDNPITYLQHHGYLSKINRYKIPTNIEIDLTATEKAHLERYFDFPPEYLTRLGKNTFRNATILHEIVKLCNDNLCSIVFTTSIEQGYLLSTLLNEKNCSAQMVDGTTPTHIRMDAIKKFKEGELEVLLNYNILTTGFDAPNVDAIVIARPTTSIVLYNQMLGRGIRGEKVGGKKTCILLDIVDNLNSLPDEAEAFNYFNSYWEA